MAVSFFPGLSPVQFCIGKVQNQWKEERFKWKTWQLGIVAP